MGECISIIFSLFLAATILSTPVFASAASATGILGATEGDEIDLVRSQGAWVSIENENYISLNFSEHVSTDTAGDKNAYMITSSDDPAYSAGKKPVAVGVRVRGLSAPLPDRRNELTIATHVFLELPKKLIEGKHYTVSAKGIGANTDKFTFVWSDTYTNENIKVNQVGYLTTGEKLAYVGEYAGTLGAVPFSISTFTVIDASGKAAWSGKAKLEWKNNRYTGENTYVLDFSAFKTPGLYKIKVPGVGVSYEFRIGEDVYSEVLGVAMKGAYHQRSGTALTEEFTRFTHGLSHNLDATVMPHNPLPKEFVARFGDKQYYPTALSGTRLDVTKGHYDAGDYGKYTVNGAYFVGNILAAYEAFPQKLQQDDLQIPESGDGIPDILQEAKWELDWLENMQDPNDGGVFCIVKPDMTKEFYENRKVDDPRNLPRQLYPKDTTCTGAYAGALAKAGRSALIRKYYPDAAKRYVEKAEKAWTFLESHQGFLGWHHYGTMEDATDKSMDDRVWASVELFGATGKNSYKEFFLKNHKPEEARWSWIPLFGSNGQATLACAFMPQDVGSKMKERCTSAIIAAGDMHVRDSEKQPYHLSLYDDPLAQKNFGWTFLQERIYQLAFADAVQPSVKYTKAAINNWNYILGANPTSYSYITGIGTQRLREPVHTQSVFDGIEPAVSGIPVGLSSSNSWIESYGKKISETYPSSYPALRLPYDSYNVVAEFVIPEVAQNIIAAAYFDTVSSAKNVPPQIQNVGASATFGAVPLSVAFSPVVTDADGTTVNYFWDFGDGMYSHLKNPTHVFIEPYHQYQVTLTVTDNSGAEDWQTIVVETKPGTASFATQEHVPDENSIALFHFNVNVADFKNQYVFTTTGKTKIDNKNVFWSEDRKGNSVAFSDLADTASVSIPADAFPQGPITIEAKIYVEEYVAYGRGTGELFGVYQDWDRQVMFRDEKYAGLELINYTPTKQEKLLSGDTLKKILPKGQWHEVRFVLGDTTKIIIDGKTAAEGSALALRQSTKPVIIKIGGFKGFVDEVRIVGATLVPTVQSSVPAPPLPIPESSVASGSIVAPIARVPEAPVSDSLELLIDSPEAKTYENGVATIRVRISRPGSCTYSIDGGSSKQMIVDYNSQGFSATETLSSGLHTLQAQCADFEGSQKLKSVVFSVSAVEAEPLLLIVDSPETKGYGKEIAMRFRISRPGICMYSIGSGAQKSMLPDFNTQGFSAKEIVDVGYHVLTASCRDSNGIAVSKAVQFSVW